MVIFAGGKFRENVGKTFHLWVIFTILLIYPSERHMGFIFAWGVIFAKMTKSRKPRKLPPREISTFTVAFSNCHAGRVMYRLRCSFHFVRLSNTGRLPFLTKKTLKCSRLVGCFDDLRLFGDISAISRLESSKKVERLRRRQYVQRL